MKFKGHEERYYQSTFISCTVEILHCFLLHIMPPLSPVHILEEGMHNSNHVCRCLCAS